MKLWGMREKKIPEEQRQLGQYLTGVILMAMIFGIGGGMVISSANAFAITFALIIVIGIGWSILIAFGAARVIYEECIKEGCKNEP